MKQNSEPKDEVGFATRAVHAGRGDFTDLGVHAPPLDFSSTYPTPDLETAARAGTASTGHGRRGTFGKPGITFSNLMVGVGDADEAALLREVGHGLVVEDLIGVGQGNVVSGAFSHPVALAYRVDGGEITGRVKDAAVAGNAYDLLKRIRRIGRDGKWIGGSRLVPPMVLDAVNVARR